MSNAEPNGPDGPSHEQAAAMLDCLNALHALPRLARAGELADRLLGLLGASAVALDVATPGSPPVRLATAGDLPDELPEPLDAAGWTDDRDSADGPSGGDGPGPVELLVRPPGDDRAAVLRSVHRTPEKATAVTLWRTDAFDVADAALLRLLHPRVAWAITTTTPPPAGATGRVLQLMLFGLSEKEIARRLNRSAHTVHAHIKRVYRHYGVRSRPELMASHFGVRGDD